MNNNENIHNLLNKIRDYGNSVDTNNIKNLFASNPNRFEEFSCQASDWLFDFSKTPIDSTILNYLLELSELANIEALRDAMFRGKKINNTENRAVLHTALRSQENNFSELNDLYSEIQDILTKMKNFYQAIDSGAYTGSTGKKITDVVNIGIGGSDLGPRMVVEALAPYRNAIKTHFVSNIDSADIADSLKNLNAETTLFIVTSKTFTTLETIENAIYAKLWLNNRAITNIKKHFVAITSNVTEALKFGIAQENCFVFWDCIGGRYSLWGAVGLPIMLAIGCENFEALLNGAYNMDKHFLNTPPRYNIAILFGLINYYYRLCCSYNNVAVIPYEQRLKLLPNYLQQLIMESNGKTVDRNGNFITIPSGSLIWGGIGTDAQHAFFQYLHQGSEVTPVEFIAFANGFETCEQALKQRQILLANCLAQSQALLEGSDASTTDKHKHFTGNRPSITILFKKLSPYQLGQILALYEHRTFVEGILFNINSFDQWGVELGKKLATNLRNNKLTNCTNYNVKLMNFLNNSK